MLDASRDEPTCIQYNGIIRIFLGEEDCLTLNVYTHNVGFPYLLLRYQSVERKPVFKITVIFHSLNQQVVQVQLWCTFIPDRGFSVAATERLT